MHAIVIMKIVHTFHENSTCNFINRESKLFDIIKQLIRTTEYNHFLAQTTIFFISSTRNLQWFRKFWTFSEGLKNINDISASRSILGTSSIAPLAKATNCEKHVFQ